MAEALPIDPSLIPHYETGDPTDRDKRLMYATRAVLDAVASGDDLDLYIYEAAENRYGVVATDLTQSVLTMIRTGVARPDGFGYVVDYESLVSNFPAYGALAPAPAFLLRPIGAEN